MLALGGSISLIASNTNAVLQDKVEEIELGLTGILGAAVFEFTVGFAIGCFLIKKNYKIAFSIIARDLIIYLIVLVILYYCLEMRYITFYKSLIMFLLWILYMIYLVLTSKVDEDDMALVQLESDREESFYSDESNMIKSTSQSKESFEEHFNSAEYSKLIHKEEFEKILTHKEVKDKTQHRADREAKKLKLIETIENDHSIFKFLIKGLFKILSRPWEMLLELLTPKSNEGIYLLIHFLVPSVLIWNASEIELFILEKIIRRLNVSANFLGLTLTAWGNNAPDMFNVASAMSKGMVDLAINAAIASEIHNILIGLGLPWLVYNIIRKKPLIFSPNHLYAFTLFFFCFFVLSFIIGFKINKMRLDYKFAVFLILTYLIFLFMIFIISFEIKS